MQSTKKVFSGVLILCGVLFVIVIIHIHTADRKAAYEYTETAIYYVEKGDTLWNIALQYSDNRHDVREVIYLIRYELNDNISPTIHEYQAITVPIFDCMKGD